MLSYPFLPEASFGLRPSVCVHVSTPSLWSKFGPEVQNTLFKILIACFAIDLDLEGQI